MDDSTGDARTAILNRRYLSMHSMLIYAAFDGKPQPFVFCDDVMLELYLEDGELHWRKCEGERADTSR